MSFGLLEKVFSGETGIQTLDTVTRMPHFECGPIVHSGISPFCWYKCKGFPQLLQILQSNFAINIFVSYFCESD